MTAAASRMPTLASTLWPTAHNESRLVQNVLLALVGSALLTLSAKVQVPLYPVPISMQTFVVLVLGMTFGWRLGLATVLLYLAEGAAGLPVFANTPERGIGLPYMMGPTGGFLVGFALAALFCGLLAERGWDRSLWRTAIAIAVGHAIILSLGWAWLAVLTGSAAKAYAVGVYPFYEATIYKTLLAVAVMPGSWWLIGRFRK
jgi:biotin transport system substrate-specific component